MWNKQRVQINKYNNIIKNIYNLITNLKVIIIEYFLVIIKYNLFNSTVITFFAVTYNNIQIGTIILHCIRALWLMLLKKYQRVEWIVKFL